MQLKVSSILQGKVAPSFSEVSGSIPLFKTKSTTVSLVTQAATNLHVNGHTFQKCKKNILQCGKGSQQPSCVCRTQLGLGGHQWEHASMAHTPNRHCRKTMSWTQTLEDACCSGKKARKHRRAEACIVNYPPGYKKGEHGQNRTWGSFQKERESKIQLGV